MARDINDTGQVVGSSGTGFWHKGGEGQCEERTHGGTKHPRNQIGALILSGRPVITGQSRGISIIPVGYTQKSATKIASE